MKQSLVEAYWEEDRKRLVQCRDMHYELIKFYQGRDTAITGSQP